MTLADGASPGGLGFLVFVVFIIAAVVIFVAMSRSLRRMRSHVDRGDFGNPAADRSSSDADRTPPAA
jgi:uncharacterized membrane protein